MLVSVINDGHGNSRIHAADCRDVAREAKRYRDDPWTFNAPTRHEVNLSVWGDVSADVMESGSPEWHAMCDESADYASVFLPCTGDLPQE
jgi:hypothetical protein